MANYSNLKAAIAAAIKTNGNQEITGQVLQDVLTSMVSVIGDNYTFTGVATPETNPGTPDQNVVYMASQAGTYSNFNGTVLPAGISLMMWNGAWTSINLLNLDDYQPIIIEGDVTNAPDEEDLTSVNERLRLKNRNIRHGMGCIYLRRELGFAEQLTQENTIYVIRYDYTLTADVTIPANCVLKFDGGSISGNVTLIGNNTIINGGLIKIFETNVSFSGSWKYSECYPEWWGAKGDDINDDTNAFHALASFITNIGGGRVYIPDHTYKLTEAIYMEGNIEMYGCGDKSVLHLANSSVGININREVVHAAVGAYLTDGNGTITGKDTSDNDVTCKCTVKGDITIKVSDASKFDEGEYYFIRDNVDFSFDNSRAYYRQGEIIRVKSKDTTNNTITLYNGLYGVYGNDQNFEGYVARPSSERDTFAQRFISALEDAVHRTEFFKLTLYNVNLRNFKIYSEGDGTSTEPGHYAMFVLNIINSEIDGLDIRTDSGSHTAFRVQTAYKSSVKRCRIYSDFVGTDSYGAGFGDIQHFICSDCSFGGRAHSLATGSTLGVVNRDFIYERLIFDNIVDANPLTELKITLDVHAGAEYYTYRNIFCPDLSCDTGGYHVTIENCNFAVISTSFFRSDLTVRNCKFSSVTKGLSFNNPWHDYSKDNIIIENCVGDDRHLVTHSGASGSGCVDFDGGISTSAYRINSLVVQNCTFNKRMYLRYSIANNIIIENNNIYCDKDEAIIFYMRRNYDENSNIVIKGNVLKNTQNYPSISIGYNINESNVETKGGKVFIENNNIIARPNSNGFIFLGDVYNAIIKNNYFKIVNPDKLGTRSIYCVDSDVFIDNNVYENCDKYFDASNANAILGYNIRLGRNNIGASTFKIAGTGTIIIPKGSTGQRPTAITVSDLDYKYFDTTLNKQLTLTFKPSGNIIKDVADIGTKSVIVANDLVDNQIYQLNVRHKTTVYLSKVDSNPTADDLLMLGGTSSNGWYSLKFKNVPGYPYIYAVTANDSDYQFQIEEVNYWTEDDGAVAGVKRSGATTDRPLGNEIYVGFMYLDTTLGKPIYASAISGDTVTWVDATGTPV